MPQRRVTVASTVGLHARPAAVVARTAAEQPVRLRISKDGNGCVEAGNVLGLMTLGAHHGDEVLLTAEGEGAESALETMAAVVRTDLAL